jgi:putative transposase
MAWRFVGISETCYRYQKKLSDESALIAQWLLHLTDSQHNWGFGLCYLFLRNVKMFVWNHKRVHRIYKELELNLRIKPRRRLDRTQPEPLEVPDAIDKSWSMKRRTAQDSAGQWAGSNGAGLSRRGYKSRY